MVNLSERQNYVGEPEKKTAYKQNVGENVVFFSYHRITGYLF